MKRDFSVALCAIFKDEEYFMKGFLECFVGHFDEYILVDTGSSDNSPAMVERSVDKVFNYTWEGDFSKARNFTIQHCLSDWIFFLDIDERIRTEDLNQMMVLIQKSSEAHAFLGPCISLSDENWKDSNPNIRSQHQFMRIFRNHPDLRYSNAIHETLQRSLEENSLNVMAHQIPIYHLGYSGDLYLKKIQRNKDMLDQLKDDFLKDPESEDPAFAYYYSEKNWDGSKDTFSILLKGLEHSEGKLLEYLSESLYAWFLDFPDFQNRPGHCAVELENQLRELNPQSPLFLLKLARDEIRNQSVKRAIQYYRSIRPTIYSESKIQFYKAEILTRLGWLHACQGSFDLALECFQEYVGIYGIDTVAFLPMAKILISSGKDEEAFQWLKSPPADLSQLPPGERVELLEIMKYFEGKGQELENLRDTLEES